MDTLESAPPHSAAAEEEDAIFTLETGAASATVSAPAPWHPLTRLGFRIAFIYFCGFIYLYGSDGTDFHNIVIWRGFTNFLNWPLNQVLVRSGQHIFHVKNMPLHWHVTDRGDTRSNWVLDRLLIVGSMVGGLVWGWIGRLRGSRRVEYTTLLAWLRFLLRLTVGFFMISYGMIKVFPLQMPPISLAILNQPAGQMTPHALLWSVVGLYPLYESICGALEVIAGTLVLFRRTALAGTLLCIFIMSNIVLYNFFFGVHVKLFALNLLLAEIFIVLPDAVPLFDFFWRHQAATQTGMWTPPLANRSLRLYVRFLEVIFLVVSFTFNPLFDGVIWNHKLEVARIQSPLLGAWHLDSTHPASGPFVTPRGPATEIYIDTVERGMRRSKDGTLWHANLTVDSAAHTLLINPFFGRIPVSYEWRMPDANHLILTARVSDGATPESKAPKNVKPTPVFNPDVVTLTRLPLPAHYRLLDRSFHLVSHGATER